MDEHCLPTLNGATTSDDEKMLVPASTVAKMMSISVRSLWRLLSAGRLVPPVRLGRSVRWHVAEVRGWIDAGCPPLTEFYSSVRPRK
jgi:predicted DNA-binding transcriptional regulator AlpA